jgi:hypothetical protein
MDPDPAEQAEAVVPQVLRAAEARMRASPTGHVTNLVEPDAQTSVAIHAQIHGQIHGQIPAVILVVLVVTHAATHGVILVVILVVILAVILVVLVVILAVILAVILVPALAVILAVILAIHVVNTEARAGETRLVQGAQRGLLLALGAALAQSHSPRLHPSADQPEPQMMRCRSRG